MLMSFFSGYTVNTSHNQEAEGRAHRKCSPSLGNPVHEGASALFIRSQGYLWSQVQVRLNAGLEPTEKKGCAQALSQRSALGEFCMQRQRWAARVNELLSALLSRQITQLFPRYAVSMYRVSEIMPSIFDAVDVDLLLFPCVHSTFAFFIGIFCSCLYLVLYIYVYILIYIPGNTGQNMCKSVLF